MARKSLGTLTLDLIAKVSGFEQGMDKASRKSQNTAKQIERYSNQIGAAITAGTAAAITGMTALVASTANGAREIRNLSALAGASPQQFQKLTYAAKRYGIEQEKVSDILKDTNDRIGDFIQTGGGPLADFMENIAPKVGVTADEFARLSGPDALQLYVRSLEEAGVSQKDMTFYMEAIASDATALIPLLRDNGEELKNLGDEAERTGNVFSEIEFDQLGSIRRSMDELTGAAAGMKNEVVLAALPAIEDLVDMLSDESTIESAKSLGNAIVASVSAAIEMIDGAVKVAKFLGEELAAAVHGAAFGDLPRMQEEIDQARQEMEKLIDEYNRPRLLRGNPFISTEDLGEKVEDARDHLHSLQAAYKSAAEAQANALSGSGNAGNETGAGGNAGGGGGRNTPSLGQGNGGSGGATGGLGGADEVDQAMIDRRTALLSAFETERQQILAAYAETQNEIRELESIAIEEGGLTQMQAAHLRLQNERQKNEALAELRQQDLADNDSYWHKWMESAEKNLLSFDDLSKTVIDNFTTGFGSAIESLVFDAQTLDDALKGIAETILRSVVNSLGQMAAQWIALQAVQMATGTSATAATVGQAAIAGAAWAPAAAAASLATLGTNAAPAAGALASTHALSKTLSLTGMAHDGIDSVPKEGTWLLDKGERVLTSTQADNLDAFLARQQAGGGSGTVVNVIEDNSRAGETETKRGSDGQEEVNVFVADIMGGGPRAKAMQTAFGLKRQGY